MFRNTLQGNALRGSCVAMLPRYPYSYPLGRQETFAALLLPNNNASPALPLRAYKVCVLIEALPPSFR